MSTTPPAAGTMEPKLGRALWQMLHTLASNYPEVANRQCRHLAMSMLVSFRDSLLHLPGKTCHCRSAFVLAMQHFPPPLTGRAEFTAWMNALHDLVNLKLGKPRFWPRFQHALLTADAWDKLMPGQPVPAEFSY